MRVCLVGATHLSNNPRLVREADSLVEAGHDVRVVAPYILPELVQKDERLLARRKWRLRQVDCRSVVIRGRRRLAWGLFSWVKKLRVAENGYTLALPELLALASREPADWFIAHTQAALPVAAAAARCWQARLGFDCEDVLPEPAGKPTEITKLIETAYVSSCAYVSVPSRCIASQLARDYGITAPVVLYNVFPLQLADGLLPPEERPRSSILRLHWFGQTIGRGRGIEDAIEAMGIMGGEVELHLRGLPAKDYQDELYAFARRCGVAGRLKFHAPVDHDDLIRTMDQFDVGLALERPAQENYSRTVTNKLFSYLVAGLAVAATDTPGQREVLSEIPAAGFIYPAGNPRALAKGLQNWLSEAGLLRATQRAAWEAARKRFCWDKEREKFLEKLERAGSVGAKGSIFFEP